MNAKEAKEAVAKYGSQRAAERALGVGTGTICRLLKGEVRSAAVRGDGRKGCPETNVCVVVGPSKTQLAPPETVGITLSPATRICDRRPPVTVRSKFYTLAKGKAFKVAELTRQWGFSAETIKRHARDEGCFAYVDTTGHDDFEECVMHPETAASRLKG